jgi:hypothetical protein
MADNKLLQQMLESLVNDDQTKAEELFHEYVVTASREIYESLIDSEIAEEEEKEEDEEEVDEASEEDEDDEKVEENFDDIAIEGDDEMPPMGGDPTDDLEGDIDGEMDDEEGGEKSEEELFQDLDSIVDELQAKFDELKGGDDMGDMGDDGEEGEEGGNPFAKEEGMGDLATVREYVEKVANGHGAEKKGAGEGALVGTGNKGQGSATNAQGMKFSKNDMGGTTANILSGRNGADAGEVGSAGGAMKGSALSDTKAGDNPHAKGNINVPGGKAGGAFSKKEPGHGAEKAGTKESPDNKQSLFRGRR